jgi:hypothetical protein
MRRSRWIVTVLTVLSLLSVVPAAPAEAARPDPWVSRLTATARWVTDTDGSRSYYVLWMDAYARNLRPRQYIVCVKVTYPDGTRVALEGYFGDVNPRTEAVARLQAGEVPEGVTALTVTAQVMRIGMKGCCTAVGALRTVEATLPVRPAPPPAISEPQLVFDVPFATP